MRSRKELKFSLASTNQTFPQMLMEEKLRNERKLSRIRHRPRQRSGRKHHKEAAERMRHYETATRRFSAVPFHILKKFIHGKAFSLL